MKISMFTMLREVQLTRVRKNIKCSPHTVHQNSVDYRSITIDFKICSSGVTLLYGRCVKIRCSRRVACHQALEIPTFYQNLSEEPFLCFH